MTEWIVTLQREKEAIRLSVSTDTDRLLFLFIKIIIKINLRIIVFLQKWKYFCLENKYFFQIIKYHITLKFSLFSIEDTQIKKCLFSMFAELSGLDTKWKWARKILPGNDSPHSSDSDLVGVDVVAHRPPHPPTAKSLHRTADGLGMEGTFLDFLLLFM